MDSLLASINYFVDSFDPAIQAYKRKTFKPVRIAILDSGFNPVNPLVRSEDGECDPRIKEVRNFVNQTNPFDIQDEIGRGTQ